MPRYGQKGGDGATAGRKAETLVFTIAGTTYRKRVFFGQRFITICQREEWPKPIICAWRTQEEAERMDEEHRKAGCEFHAWLKAETV